MLRSDRGAVAVELGLLMPLLLVLLLGIIDFGFAFNAKIAVTQAAREGVRVMAVDPYGPPSAASTRVDIALTSNGQVLPVTTTFPSSCLGGDPFATVQVSGSYDPILPLPLINLTARGVMQCE